MRDPSGKEDVCVQCGKTFPVGQSSTATNHASPSVEVKENDTTTQVKDNEMENKVDASMLLADRMVQGWKMLAEHCPVCQTPLL